MGSQELKISGSQRVDSGQVVGHWPSLLICSSWEFLNSICMCRTSPINLL